MDGEVVRNDLLGRRAQVHAEERDKGLPVRLVPLQPEQRTLRLRGQHPRSGGRFAAGFRHSKDTQLSKDAHIAHLTMYGSNVTYILNYSSSGDMDDTLMIRQDSSATILVYVIVFGEKKRREGCFLSHALSLSKNSWKPGNTHHVTPPLRYSRKW